MVSGRGMVGAEKFEVGDNQGEDFPDRGGVRVGEAINQIKERNRGDGRGFGEQLAVNQEAETFFVSELIEVGEALVKLRVGEFDEVMAEKISLDGGERPGGVIGFTGDEEAVLGPGGVGGGGVGGAF